jgi:hypothetical protein
MIRPTHCYLGPSKDGKLEIYVSESVLNPLGPRLLHGDKFPDAVYEFYQDSRICPQYAANALKSAEAYLRGEEVGSGGGGLVFGQSSTPKRTRKK